MKGSVQTNALSRIAGLCICDSSESAEAMPAFMNQQSFGCGMELRMSILYETRQRKNRQAAAIWKRQAS